MSTPREETTVSHEHLKEDQSDTVTKEQEEQQKNTLSEDNDSESKEQKEKTSLWTPVWDDNAQAYYWWNTKTNETTWIDPASKSGGQHTSAATATDLPANASNPLDFLLDRIDKVVKRKLDNGEQVNPADLPENMHYGSYYGSYYDQEVGRGEASYTATAQFNAKTGRFTTQEDASRLNPENLTLESRAKRQMQHYFDVDSYTEQRNSQLARTEDGRVGKKKQLSRKEVEYFKKIKKEKKSKKAREWLMQ